MHTILNLLKLQIDNKTDLLKTASPSKMLRELFKKLFIILLIFLIARTIFVRIVMFGVTVNAELIALILLIVQGISLAFSVGRIINTLYTCKDNEMLICLPVTPNQLFISKIIVRSPTIIIISIWFINNHIKHCY